MANAARLAVVLLATGCLNTVPEALDSGAAGGGALGTGGGSGGSSGGSGLGGGSADGGTCGCTSNGRCVVGDSPLACGNTGGVCSRCAMGEQCVNGQCVVAACGPMTCSGCCGMGFCVAASTQSGLACGLGGGMCTRCMNGQQCRSGACVTPVCDAMTCPMGCCQNGRCSAGNTGFACGANGAACATCAMGEMCRGGACMMGNADAGPPAPIGSPCMGGSSCGTGQFCLPDQAGFPMGYCSAQCMMGACPAGSTCVTNTAFGFTQSACFAMCGTCRVGYACQPGADGGSAYCRPHCIGGGVAACPMGTTCEPDAGTCL